MSRLTDLLAQVKTKDAALGADLEAEFRVLSERRVFGLNFERHRPEAVELPQRPVRKGDKVRVLPPRGSTTRADQRLWRILRTEAAGAGRNAHIVLLDGDEAQIVALGDLVVMAEFRDPIYPGLRSTGRVERGGDKPYHTVINAENYHALQTLLFTHRGRVDCIYIDPPYNTGAKDWKYNNDYVDGEDIYRHSKWLAFMERRLRIAKELLNPSDSALICAIDENEVHRLTLLLEQVFPGSKIQMVSVLINPAGASIIDQFSRVDEHLLFVQVGSARPQRTQIDTTPGYSTFVTASGEAKPFQWEPFQRSGGNSRRQDTKAKFFPIHIHEGSGIIVGCGDHLLEGVDRNDAPPPPPECVSQWPNKRDGTEACWQLSAPTFREYLSQGRIRIGDRSKTTNRWGLSFLTKGHMAAIQRGELVVDGRDEKGSLIVRNAEGKVRSQVGKTLWTNGSYSATEHGSTFLSKLLPGRRFPFPKSLYAVEDALRYYVHNKPNAVILDFFAGSGTTAHAVMRLNSQDGGKRQCLLVTNNEVGANEQEALRKQNLRPGDPKWEQWGICDYITKPRIEVAITGKTPNGKPIDGDYRFTDEFPVAEGFAENVEFFTLTYETPWRVARNREFTAIAPLLWLRAGARGRRIDAVPAEGWDVAEAYGVLVDLDQTKPFLDAVDTDDMRIAFIVTDDERRFQMICAGLPERIEPVRLYESYLANFEINTGRE